MKHLLLIFSSMMVFSCTKDKQCFYVKAVSSNNHNKVCGRSNSGWEVTKEVIIGEVCDINKLRQLEKETNQQWHLDVKCRTDQTTTRVYYKIEIVSTPL